MFKKKLDHLLVKTKKLQGDPHYVALGMSIGVFIAITPTIPFHTVLAVLLAYLLKASKPAAIIGVWVSNPFTVVFGSSINGSESISALINHLEGDFRLWDKILFFFNFMKNKAKIFAIMNLGGLIIGLPAGVVTYFLTKNFIIKVRKPILIQKDES